MTRLADKIPVPQLDEHRLARLEGRVVAVATASDLRPERVVPWWRVAAVTIAIAAAALLWTAWPQGSATPLPTMTLPAIVVTGPGERASLELGDAVVSIGESSRLSVHRGVDGVVLGLEAGDVDCEVEERSHRAPFQVRAGEVTVTVVGTGFRVVRRETVRVTVEHGVVEVSTPHGSTRLERGDHWEGSDGGEPRVASAADSRAGDEDEEMAASRTAPRRINPHEDEAATETRRDRSRRDRDRDRTPNRNRNRTPNRDRNAVAASEAATPPRRSSSPAARDPAIAELLRIETDDPARAADDFLTLAARRSGNVASFALYSRAYLQLVRLDQARRAVETARQYDRRFPRGDEADPMHWIRIRGLCAIGDATGCRAAAYSYLRRHPQGRFAGEARAITRR